jgi:acetyl-CoA carboxylase carboxyltransferase component
MSGAAAGNTLLQIQEAALKSKGFAIGAEEKKELLDKILKQYNEQLCPYYAAARLWVDGVIDPAETRKIVSMGIEAANHAPITERYNVGIIQT